MKTEFRGHTLAHLIFTYIYGMSTTKFQQNAYVTSVIKRM